MPETRPGDRSARAQGVILLLAGLLAAMSLVSLHVGATGLRPLPVLADLLAGREPSLRDRVILLDIRLPRLLTAVLVGAALAVAGALMQGLFRNPLADPGIVGVGAGAGLGAVTAIVLGALLPAWAAAGLGMHLVPVAAFFGGWASTLILYRVSTRGGRTSVATMLLAGIALGALAGAATGLLIYIADC